MEDTNAPDLPINAAQPEPPVHDGVSGMMARFEQMKAVETAAPAPAAEAPAPAETAKPDVNQEPQPADTEADKPQRAKWGELKTKAQERDELVTTKIPEYERKIAELEQKAAMVPDTTKYDQQIKELQEQKDRYEKIVAVKAVEESPQFHDTVIRPLQEIAAKTAHIAAAYGLTPSDLQQALQIENPAVQMARLNELMVDFDGAHKAKIWDMAEKSQELLNRAWQMQQHATETKKELDALTQQEKQKADSERQQRLTASQQAVQDSFLKSVPELFKDEKARAKIFAAKVSDDPVMATYNAFAGEALAVAVTDMRAKDARIKELEGELAARASLQPKPANGSGHQHPAAVPAQVDGGSMWQRYQNLKATGAMS